MAQSRRRFLIVGGMPAAVRAYGGEERMEDVSRVHQLILQSFADDFAKYRKRVNVGRLRKVRVAAVLCNVVLFEQDVQQGVADYASAEQAMMAGEQQAIAAALHALVQ